MILLFTRYLHYITWEDWHPWGQILHIVGSKGVWSASLLGIQTWSYWPSSWAPSSVFSGKSLHIYLPHRRLPRKCYLVQNSLSYSWCVNITIWILGFFFWLLLFGKQPFIALDDAVSTAVSVKESWQLLRTRLFPKWGETVAEFMSAWESEPVRISWLNSSVDCC